jgi:hypothetical protein
LESEHPDKPVCACLTLDSSSAFWYLLKVIV